MTVTEAPSSSVSVPPATSAAAFGSDTSIVTPEPADEPQVFATGEEGSLGTRWVVSVGETIADAGSLVYADNPNAIAPPEGYQMVGVWATARHTGAGTPVFSQEVMWSYVSPTGFIESAPCGPLLGIDTESEPTADGESSTVFACVFVPELQIEGGHWRVQMDNHEALFVGA